MKALRVSSRRALFAAMPLLLLAVAFAASERAGWPWLAPALQSWLTGALEREVSVAGGTPAHPFRLHVWGGLDLHTPRLVIAAPAWSGAPHLLRADDVALQLRYIDLWRAWRGQPLRVQSLRAAALDVWLERGADGRSSWQLGGGPTRGAADPWPLPVLGDFRVPEGQLQWRDPALALDLQARFSIVDTAEAGATVQAQAGGSYRGLPLAIALAASGVLPGMAGAGGAGGPGTASGAGGMGSAGGAGGTGQTAGLPLRLQGTIGRARLAFEGRVAGLPGADRLEGRFSLEGPSLAAVGDLVGVTLPTTPAFHASGELGRQGLRWQLRVADATVGSSRLKGEFSFDAGRLPPLLSGRLQGSRLLLADLGPAVGTAPAASAQPAPAHPTSTPARGKVLPDREFNLASLRAMDADVGIEIAEVDLQTRWLEPLRPLRARLQLAAGVLTLRDLDAQTAQGRLTGTLSLDGRGDLALWTAQLRWRDVRLQDWVHQARAAGLPPFVAGRLEGAASLQGRGRSTAEILASLNGQARTELHEGTVSHMALELAGLDLYHFLGVQLAGDDALPVPCAVADLVAADGVLRPRVMVLDTHDTAIWVEGSLSLAQETLDLRALASPRDFSPLSLRSPLRVRGSFAHPEVSLDRAAIGRQLGGALLLALLNPLAALIPLADAGDAAGAARAAAGCRALSKRIPAALASAAPAAATKPSP